MKTIYLLFSQELMAILGLLIKIIRKLRKQIFLQQFLFYLEIGFEKMIHILIIFVLIIY